MQRRYRFGLLILAIAIVLNLTLLMVCVDAQARIAFASSRDGHIRNDIPGLPAFEIYVMDADGKHQRRLTNNPASDHSPSWSPDGKRIAFVSDRDGHPDRITGWHTPEIYVMNADGSNPQNLTNNPAEDTSPSWSPDGKRIAFDSNRDGPFNWEIYVMDADGGNLQNLTNNPDDDGWPDDRYPSWSPDGQRIVFSARRDGHVENKFAVTYEIYVMDSDGGNQQRLTENRKNDESPSWSPDGQRIVFESDRKGEFENYDIYVMDSDGGNLQKLTNTRGWDTGASWSPDGNRITFMSERAGNTEIYVMNADGGNPQNLTNNPGGDFHPAWLNSPFSVSPAGKKFTMWGSLKQVDR